MALTIINRGSWSVYKPNPYPANWPQGVLFAKSETGKDWYDALGYNGKTPLFASGSVLITIDAQNKTHAANIDPTKIFPGGMTLLEVQGYTGIDAQNDLGYGKLYNAAASTIGPAPIDLVAYANSKQWAKATAGYKATLSGTSYVFKTDSESRSLVAGKYMRFLAPNPPASVIWQVATNQFITITAADFATLAVGMDDYVQATFDTLNTTVLPGIANNTITTTAQIDSAFA